MPPGICVATRPRTEGRTVIVEIIGLIIFGAVIGALARFFMKGNQNIGMVWTIILGIL